ncbi:MAG: dipicolinate synthase subunit B [Firmicutes bacterium]|nr:dipicolinate synthase subunit B [Bacillota bacterium]
MDLAGVKIGFALTGSFCTFGRVFPQIERLLELDAEIIPIVSKVVRETDTRFGPASCWLDRLQSLTGRAVLSEITEVEPFGPQKQLDVLVVAPCTGNTLAKLANGIVDETVPFAVKAHLRNERPVVLAVSTNDGLAGNAKNIGSLLNIKNVYMVPFGQDAPESKHNSLVAKMELIPETVAEALDGRQIQPVIIAY